MLENMIFFMFHFILLQKEQFYNNLEDQNQIFYGFILYN